MERDSHSPSPEAVRLQVSKITSSQRFAAAPSLARFLHFVVEETIAGRGTDLKEYLIGVEVFGRGEDFDPRIDPIVRVQAVKLRKRLQEFYDEEGEHDEVVIELHRGSYVPIIHPRATKELPAPDAVTDAVSTRPAQSARIYWRRLAIAIGLMAAAASFWRFVLERNQGKPYRFALSRLTSDSGHTTHPAVSADGRLLAFSADRGPQGDSNIWVQPVSGGDARQLTRHPAADTSPDFSPSGSHVVFRSWRDGGGIYLVPVLEGQERRIAVGGYSPRFSPDGKWVAYAQGGIQVVPAAGGEPFRVSGGVSGVSCPLWTPDGRNLIFVGESGGTYEWWVAPLARDRPPFPARVAEELRKIGLKGFDETACPSDWMGNDVVFTLKVEGMGNLWKAPLSPKTWKAAGLASQLVPGPGVDHARVLRTEESFRLIFATDTNVSHIWSLPLDVNRSEPRREIAQLTRDASLVGGLSGTRPILTANGDRLIFSSARSGNLDLWMKDLNTGKEESLTSDPRPEDRPVADAAGVNIAYQVSEGGRKSIHAIDPGKGVPRKLCDNCEYPMDLSPDGTVLLYRGIEPWGFSLLDLRTSQPVTLLKDPKNVPVEASFSPDMRSIAVVVRKQNQERLFAYIAPFEQGKLGAESAWVPVVDEMFHLYLRWSPEGNLLYYFASTDDYRCLWAARVDPVTRRLAGSPYAVRHFHTVQHYPLSGSWISVARNRLAFNLTDVTSNIWMAALE